MHVVHIAEIRSWVQIRFSGSPAEEIDCNMEGYIPPAAETMRPIRQSHEPHWHWVV